MIRRELNDYFISDLKTAEKHVLMFPNRTSQAIDY